MQYAIEFLSLSTLEYRRVWWRLFNCPSAAKWSNTLSLAQLLLALPASNGKLERSFSQMNIIKTNKRSLLSNNTLDDLLLIDVDGTALAGFNPDSAIDLWWKNKKRRPNQQKQKSCEQIPSMTSATPSTSASVYCPESDSDSEQIQDILSDWDTYFN